MTNGTPQRILLIDDNLAIHEDFRKILSSNNISSNEFAQAEAAVFGTAETIPDSMQFEIDSAFQGKEGLACVQKALQEKRPYAVAFVDVRMPPGWDGIETISELWKVDPALQVIICTAYSDYSWEEMVGRLGKTDRLLILKKPFDNIEVRQLACSMTEKWNVARELQNHINNLQGLVRDRTAGLENSLSLTRATLESTSDGILVVSKEGKVTNHNKKFFDMWRTDPELVEQMDERALLTHLGEQLKDPKGLLQRVTEVCSQDEPESFDVLEFKDGRIFERYSLPQRIHGVTIGRVWNFRDVTKRESIANQLRQSQKMQAVGQLAGGMAHDFNNILTVIIGYTELLLNRLEAGDKTRRDVEEIRIAADRASRLTRQLLAYSRRQVLLPRVLDLNVVTNEMTAMLKRLIGENIDLACLPQADLWRTKADPGQIEQVLMNLAINARDAMPEGGTLTLQTGNAVLDERYATANAGVTAGEYVMLAITDTGVGMSEEAKSHVFEPFYTTKPQGQGTGLGLATCYGIIKQSGGHINVYSEPGRGTTFKVYLPRVEEGVVPPARRSGPTSLPRGRETILLAEDDSAVREIASIGLRELGYTVLEAANGKDALAVLEAHKDTKIHLLFTDVVMPLMGGKELAEKLLLTAYREMKVLFASGYTQEAFVYQGVWDNRIAFLQKPFTNETLARKVRDALDN